MKNGLKAFDSDMHVYDPAFLYEKYMNPQWGERIPRGQRNGKHGRVEFSIGAGKETLRGISAVIDHGQKQVADRYDFAVARDYDAVSQDRSDGSGRPGCRGIVSHIAAALR